MPRSKHQLADKIYVEMKEFVGRVLVAEIWERASKEGRGEFGK
jgi:hypothetical protein